MDREPVTFLGVVVGCLIASADRRFQIIRASKQVQGIGIEYQGCIDCKRARQRMPCGVGLAEPGADHYCAETLSFQKFFNTANHQIRLSEVDCGPVAEHSNQYPASSQFQRGAACKEGRTHHSARSADDGNVAVASLVTVKCSRRQCGGNYFVSDQITMAVRQRSLVDTELRQMNLARVVGTVKRVQACFESKKSNRVACSNGNAHDLTAVRIDS